MSRVCRALLRPVPPAGGRALLRRGSTFRRPRPTPESAGPYRRWGGIEHRPRWRRARRGSPVIGRPATFYPHVPTVAASGPVLTSGPAVPKMNTVPTATPPKPRKPAPPRPPQQPQQDAPAPGTAPSLTHAEMMELAKKYPPPQSWYDDDTDPFTPAPAPVEK